MADPNFTRLPTSAPRYNRNRTHHQIPAHPRSFSRSTIHVILIKRWTDYRFRSRIVPAKNFATRDSIPSGICMKLVACRRNLLEMELITYIVPEWQAAHCYESATPAADAAPSDHSQSAKVAGAVKTCVICLRRHRLAAAAQPPSREVTSR